MKYCPKHEKTKLKKGVCRHCAKKEAATGDTTDSAPTKKSTDPISTSVKMATKRPVDFTVPVRIDLTDKDNDEVSREVIGLISKAKTSLSITVVAVGYRGGQRNDANPEYIMIEEVR